MSSRRPGFAAGMDGSAPDAGSRKQSPTSLPDRTESCYERRADSKPGLGASVAALKSRLAPAIQSALSAAVDSLLGEVALVLGERQQELLLKERENQQLKVRLQVSERELKSLQECLCSAQKLIDQLQVSYSGPQPGFGPPLPPMAPLDQQGAREGPELGLGPTLHGFEPRGEYKMCQLSIQADGSVSDQNLEGFSSSSPHLSQDSRGAEDRLTPGGASRFEIKEEQGANRKDGHVGEGDAGPLNAGDVAYGRVGADGGALRSFSAPLRHQRPMPQQSGLDAQKPTLGSFGPGGGDAVSPGRAEDSAGPPPPDRPHHCLECGKTFRLISSLKKHIRIHTGEKPYPCGVCGRRFRESGALKTHLRIHTGEKPYSCSECGNCFRHLDGLRKHRRTHTGEKPYVCGVCGKRLSRLQHLKHHQLIHTGERPCCCPFCDRAFKEPAALRKHVRTHRADDGGPLGPGVSKEADPDAMDDISNIHPAAPSPQMRFGEWGADEDGSVADCV